MARKTTKTSEASKPQPATTSSASVEEVVRRRAYELHLERGGAHGSDLDDWLRAEREVQARQTPTPTRGTTARKKT